MSDVVAVALISSGSSLLAATAGAIATYKVSLRSAQATIAATEAQSEVELAKIKAENARLRGNNQEEERRNRLTTYRQFIEAAWEIYQRMGASVARAEVVEAGEKYRRLTAGVLLFGSPTVREDAIEISNLYSQIWERLDQERSDHPTKAEEERWRDATEPLKEEFGKRTSAIIHLMHADVTRGITSDSEPDL